VRQRALTVSWKSFTLLIKEGREVHKFKPILQSGTGNPYEGILIHSEKDKTNSIILIFEKMILWLPVCIIYPILKKHVLICEGT
jgi:hypothetical protein